MAEATKYQDSGSVIDYTPDAAVSGGEVTQLADGRAAVLPVDLASGELGAAEAVGIWSVTKAANIAFLKGTDVFWDHSANAATYKPVSDRDFWLGTAAEDTAASASEVKVNFNVAAQYKVDLNRDGFKSVLAGTAAAGGFGYPVELGGTTVFELTATNEAQKVDLLSVQGFAPGANWIAEGKFRVISDGAGTAADLSLGVASGTNATDADSIAESAFVHLNANDTNIYAESDDGTNEVAATDTTIDYTEGSDAANEVEFWIDGRDPSSVKFYVNGAQVLAATTFNMSAAAGPLFLLAHLEKTISTDTYKIAVDKLRVRTGQL